MYVCINRLQSLAIWHLVSSPAHFRPPFLMFGRDKMAAGSKLGTRLYVIMFMVVAMADVSNSEI